jgi:SAM-dependent methyltransferase
MLNPTWPQSTVDKLLENYTLPASYQLTVSDTNSSFATGPEYRLSSVFKFELENRLNNLGIDLRQFKHKRILEVCAGTGFLTYHLIPELEDLDYSVNDISSAELEECRALISLHYPKAKISFELGNMLDLDYSEYFDVIIGNSYLHHLPDLQASIAQLLSYLKPGGSLISLHEPTPLATVCESRWWWTYPVTAFFPKSFNELVRKRNKVSTPGADVWLFDISQLEVFATDKFQLTPIIIGTGPFRTILTQALNLHLRAEKPHLSKFEVTMLKGAIIVDNLINKIFKKSLCSSISIRFKKSDA